LPQSRRRTIKRTKRPSKNTSNSGSKSTQTVKLVVSAGIALLALGVLIYMVFIFSQAGRQTSATNNTASGLKFVDEVVGTGPSAQLGQTVTVHYTGKLENGLQFDSSLDSGQPLEFTIGTPNIIQGWNEGVAGMKVGGKRKLTVPPELGYGPAGRPPKIPPNATLLFDIELLGVK